MIPNNTSIRICNLEPYSLLLIRACNPYRNFTRRPLCGNINVKRTSIPSSRVISHRPSGIPFVLGSIYSCKGRNSNGKAKGNNQSNSKKMFHSVSFLLCGILNLMNKQILLYYKKVKKQY